MQTRIKDFFSNDSNDLTNYLKTQNLKPHQLIHVTNQTNILLDFLIASCLLQLFGNATSDHFKLLHGIPVHDYGEQTKQWQKELLESPFMAAAIIPKLYRNKQNIQLPDIQAVKATYNAAIRFLFGNKDDLENYVVGLKTIIGKQSLDEGMHIELLLLSTLLVASTFKLNELFDFILQKSNWIANYEMSHLNTTPFTYAVSSFNPHMVSTLIQYGSEVNKTVMNDSYDPDNALTPSPLAVAIDTLVENKDKPEKFAAIETTIRQLLDHGADVNLMTVRGTPLNMRQRNMHIVSDDAKKILEIVINHAQNSPRPMRHLPS